MLERFASSWSCPAFPPWLPRLLFLPDHVLSPSVSTLPTRHEWRASLIRNYGNSTAPHTPLRSTDSESVSPHRVLHASWPQTRWLVPAQRPHRCSPASPAHPLPAV